MNVTPIISSNKVTINQIKRKIDKTSFEAENVLKTDATKSILKIFNIDPKIVKVIETISDETGKLITKIKCRSGNFEPYQVYEICHTADGKPYYEDIAKCFRHCGQEQPPAKHYICNLSN